MLACYIRSDEWKRLCKGRDDGCFREQTLGIVKERRSNVGHYLISGNSTIYSNTIKQLLGGHDKVWSENHNSTSSPDRRNDVLKCLSHSGSHGG